MNRAPALASLVLAAAVCLAPAAARKASPKLELDISTPVSGAVIGDPGGMAFVSGTAMALFGEFLTFDIMFVIDRSQSTSGPSGADVDQDGVTGHKRGESYLSVFGKILPLPNSDRGDSILAAEVAAVETMLDQLDPRTTRVGLVGFSGDTDPTTPDAETWVPLTSDFDEMRKGLADILAAGPSGRTNMVAGVQQATAELMGTRTAYSEPREGARRVMMFLTDGTPTLPLENRQKQNERMTIHKAKRAGEAGIRIDTFAIGERAVQDCVVAVEMANVTQGIPTPVRNPRDLVAVFENVNFAEIDALEVRNATTNDEAPYLLKNADGSFSALLPMREGSNTIEVFAKATDGTEARRKVNVRFLPEAGVQKLDARLLAQRNRLLKNRLLDLKQRRLEIESERDEDVRRDLMVEIEAERAKARERAAERMKELEIDVED